jgi:hypothetical protein
MRSGKKPSGRKSDQQALDTFLRRLERLIRMRTAYREDLNPLGLRLLDRAIESTYQDCLDFDGGVPARALMAGYVPAGDGD